MELEVKDLLWSLYRDTQSLYWPRMKGIWGMLISGCRSKGSLRHAQRLWAVEHNA